MACVAVCSVRRASHRPRLRWFAPILAADVVPTQNLLTTRVFTCNAIDALLASGQPVEALENLRRVMNDSQGRDYRSR